MASYDVASRFCQTLPRGGGGGDSGLGRGLLAASSVVTAVRNGNAVVTGVKNGNGTGSFSRSRECFGTTLPEVQGLTLVHF
jgi:hypothetical protein